MKILFVHEVSYANKVVFEIHDYPELLSLRGHDVTFVDFPEGIKPTGLNRLLALRSTVVEGYSRAHTGASVRVITPGRVLAPPFDRPLASVTHGPVIRGLLKSGNVDLVVLYGVPTNGWQTVRLAKRYGVPVLFRAIDVSHGIRKTRLAPLIRLAEHYIYRNADAISTHNVGLADYVVEHGADPDTVSIEYPGLDLERFQRRPRHSGLAAELNIAGTDRVVLFMGTLYRFAGLDPFLRLCAPWLKENPDMVVLLIGGGEEEAALRRLAADLQIESQVRITGFVDYEVLADYLSLGDVAINPFDRSEVTENALPGKVLQYLGSGLPTVSTPLRGLMGMIGDDRSTEFAELGPAFMASVMKWVDDEEARQDAARAARDLMERLCQWDSAIESFEAAVLR
ncbi:MAG: glycosyltransferase, partial [Acidimicrobiales bacterium]